MIIISSEFDDDGEYDEDKDPKDANVEVSSEVQNDLDSDISSEVRNDLDSNNLSENDKEYDPFAPLDYNSDK